MNKPIILMFGWEFPPFNSGGLGVACEGLSRALSQKGIEINFVLPRNVKVQSDFCRIIFASPNKEVSFSSQLSPYPASFSRSRQALSDCEDLIRRVRNYALLAKEIIKREKYDLIHAHDWLSFPVGIEAKKISGKPLVVQIHATEFDRTGGLSINQEIYQIEKEGMQAADSIVAVSNFTKEKIIHHYGICAEKIRVIHNAVDKIDASKKDIARFPNLEGRQKTVLFLGRITLQKGPDYFLLAAKEILKLRSDVLFVIAGDGEMKGQIIEQAINLGLSDNVIFTGFLRGEQLTKIYQSADVYVMPSVSEPFGITALEALRLGVPVIVSRQSGASEIINHCLKVDFWDIKQMVNKILAVLNYEELFYCLEENGAKEAEKFTWESAALKCLNLYQALLK